MKTGYESIALYRDVLVNMSSTLNTEMGSRERPAAPNLKKQNGDEGEDVDITIPKQMVWVGKPTILVLVYLTTVLTNREELEEVYGIPFIVTCFFFSFHFIFHFSTFI